MQTHVKKTKILFSSGLVFLVGSIGLFSQQLTSTGAPATSDQSAASTPSSPPPTPSSNQPQAPAAHGAPDGSDSSTSAALDYLFNHKPQEGSAAKEVMSDDEEAKNREMAQEALGHHQIDDPDVRTRFETYLGMNEVPQGQIKAYSTDMASVIDLLHQRKTTEAWQKLYKLAQYQTIDAGVSWELANRIESIWNAGQTKDQIAQQNEQLQHQADTANHNADLMSDDIKDQEIEYERKLQNSGGQHSNRNRGGNNGDASQGSQPNDSNTIMNPPVMTPPSDQILGKLQLTEEYLNSLADQAKIKLNELKVAKLLDQAKQDFADYITTLYKSGRFQHVLIAADFWRQVFDEGDYPVSMAQQVNASLEMNGQVNTVVGVFNNNLDQNNIAAATDNLEQAFTLNELNPAVLAIPLAKKKPVQAFIQYLARMQNMIEARDFSDLEPLLAQIKQTVPDFDSVKALSMINGVKLESQLRLGKAKLAAQEGDLKGALEEFQSAAEMWPGNPDLKDKASNFFNSQDDQTQSLEEFDRLVAENNYQAIFDKQLAFAPAMRDDPKRQQQLKDALEKVKVAETAAEKAAAMQANGDVDGAWETVELAIKDLPSDVKLNSLRGDLAGKAADFVSAINKAQDAESRQELGYSLTWYAIAQHAYPASQIANEGIDRLSKNILAKAVL